MYEIGELTPQKLNDIRHNGFLVPVYKCSKKMSCPHFTGLRGRDRCPGMLKKEPGEVRIIYESNYCGWNHDNIRNPQTNAIRVYTTDHEKYIPPDLIVPVM